MPWANAGAKAAGVPRAALQLLPGDGATVGAAITAEPRVKGVVFTGSTDTAQIIARSMAGSAVASETSFSTSAAKRRDSLSLRSSTVSRTPSESTLGRVWAPAVYTFLAMSWGAGGWLVIAGIIVAGLVHSGKAAARPVVNASTAEACLSRPPMYQRAVSERLA